MNSIFLGTLIDKECEDRLTMAEVKTRGSLCSRPHRFLRKTEALLPGSREACRLLPRFSPAVSAITFLQSVLWYLKSALFCQVRLCSDISYFFSNSLLFWHYSLKCSCRQTVLNPANSLKMVKELILMPRFSQPSS